MNDSKPPPKPEFPFAKNFITEKQEAEQEVINVDPSDAEDEAVLGPHAKSKKELPSSVESSFASIPGTIDYAWKAKELTPKKNPPLHKPRKVDRRLATPKKSPPKEQINEMVVDLTMDDETPEAPTQDQTPERYQTPEQEDHSRSTRKVDSVPLEDENPKTKVAKPQCLCKPCSINSLMKTGCGKCSWCRMGKKRVGEQWGCMFLCCSARSMIVKETYLEAIDKTRAKYKPTFNVGEDVYCHKSEADEEYHRARILKVTPTTCNVQFEDGTTRQRLPVGLMFDMFRLTMDRERKRLENDSTASTGDTQFPKWYTPGEIGIRPIGNKRWSDRRVDGSRVCVRYLLDGTDELDYHWGEISRVGGNNKVFDVLFDDGDVRVNVPLNEVLTELKYSKLPGQGPVPPRQSAAPDPPETCETLFAKRCKHCALCKMKECGTCKSCVFNKTSTTKQRKACILRICERIDPELKAQPAPSFRPSKPSPFRLYFSTEQQLTTCTRANCFCSRHEELGGVSLCVLTNTLASEHWCLHEAMQQCGYNSEDIKEYIPAIWEEITGLVMKEGIAEHHLLNKGYFHKWTTQNGGFKSVLGTITHCWRDISDDSISFGVEFNDNRFPQSRSCGAGRQIPTKHEVEEVDAWRGYAAFNENILCQNVELPINPTFKWITPITRDVVLEPGAPNRIMLCVKGFTLELKAQKSLIPGAGLGLFLTCYASQHDPQRSFVLPRGHGVDLGVYAPHLVQDLKSSAVWNIKMLLFSAASECWCCDLAPGARKSCHIFDVSNDVDGDVHAAAKSSPIAFANETDGAETPSLSMSYDPAGAVHYLLGHLGSDDGELQIPVEKEVELKIDYGPEYEQERVRKNYPRVTGENLQKCKDKIKNEDEVFANDIDTYSANDVIECVTYLEQTGPRRNASLVNDFSSYPPSFCDRFLWIVLSLGQRICSMLLEFKGVDLSNRDLCLNGFDELFKVEGVRRFRQLLRWACMKMWEDDTSFRSSVSAFPLLQDQVLYYSTSTTRRRFLKDVTEKMGC